MTVSPIQACVTLTGFSKLHNSSRFASSAVCLLTYWRYCCFGSTGAATYFVKLKCRTRQSWQTAVTFWIRGDIFFGHAIPCMTRNIAPMGLQSAWNSICSNQSSRTASALDHFLFRGRKLFVAPLLFPWPDQGIRGPFERTNTHCGPIVVPDSSGSSPLSTIIRNPKCSLNCRISQSWQNSAVDHFDHCCRKYPFCSSMFSEVQTNCPDGHFDELNTTTARKVVQTQIASKLFQTLVNFKTHRNWKNLQCAILTVLKWYILGSTSVAPICKRLTRRRNSKCWCAHLKAIYCSMTVPTPDCIQHFPETCMSSYQLQIVKRWLAFQWSIFTLLKGYIHFGQAPQRYLNWILKMFNYLAVWAKNAQIGNLPFVVSRPIPWQSKILQEVRCLQCNHLTYTVYLLIHTVHALFSTSPLYKLEVQCSPDI